MQRAPFLLCLFVASPFVGQSISILLSAMKYDCEYFFCPFQFLFLLLHRVRPCHHVAVPSASTFPSVAEANIGCVRVPLAPSRARCVRVTRKYRGSKDCGQKLFCRFPFPDSAVAKGKSHRQKSHIQFHSRRNIFLSRTLFPSQHT